MSHRYGCTLSLVLIILNLLSGKFTLDPMPDTSIRIGPWSIHAMTGMLISVMLVIRLTGNFVSRLYCFGGLVGDAVDVYVDIRRCLVSSQFLFLGEAAKLFNSL